MKSLLTAALLTISLIIYTKLPSQPDLPAAYGSVVRINSIQNGAEVEVCTGFAIAHKQVLTANHCVMANMFGDGHPLRLLKVDEYYDLALYEDLLLIKPAFPIREYPVSVGEEVWALGYAHSWNIILVMKDEVLLPSFSATMNVPPGLILRPGFAVGMSGGPIIDADNQLVGVIQRVIGQENLGYGVGTLLIRAFLLGT